MKQILGPLFIEHLLSTTADTLTTRHTPVLMENTPFYRGHNWVSERWNTLFQPLTNILFTPIYLSFILTRTPEVGALWCFCCRWGNGDSGLHNQELALRSARLCLGPKQVAILPPGGTYCHTQQAPRKCALKVWSFSWKHRNIQIWIVPESSSLWRGQLLKPSWCWPP